MKTCSVGADLFHAGRRRNSRDEADKSQFSQFCGLGPKKLKLLFFPPIINFRRSIAFRKLPGFAPLFLSDKVIVHLQMNIEHYWNDIDRGNNFLRTKASLYCLQRFSSYRGVNPVSAMKANHLMLYAEFTAFFFFLRPVQNT